MKTKIRVHIPHPHLLALLSALTFLGSAPLARAQDATAAPACAFQPRRVALTDLKPRSEWRNAGRATAEACFETLWWARVTGNLDVLADAIVIEDPARARAVEAFAKLAREEQSRMRTVDRYIAQLLSLGNPMAGIRVVGTEPNPNRSDELAVQFLNSYDDGRIRASKNVVLRHTDDGWRQKVMLRMIEPLFKTGINRPPGPITGRDVVPAMNPAGVAPPLMPGLVAAQTLQNRGNATALAAFETIHWAKARRDFAVLEQLVIVRPETRAGAAARLASLSADSRARMPEITTPERLLLADWLASNDDVGVRVDTETVLAPDRIYFAGVQQERRGVGNFDIILRHTEQGWQWFWVDKVIPGRPDAFKAH